jgi:hypothetical protein
LGDGAYRYAQARIGTCHRPPALLTRCAATATATATSAPTGNQALSDARSMPPNPPPRRSSRPDS